MKAAKILQDVLKAFLWETPLSAVLSKEVQKQAEEVFRLAAEQKVQGILAYKIREYAKMHPDEVPAEIRLAAETLFFAAMKSGAKKEAMAAAISEAFAKEKIEHLFFKGIVLRDLYPVPSLRSFIDIDLVIHGEDREKSDRALRAIGYENLTDFTEVWNYQKGGVVCEVHTDIYGNSPEKEGDHRWYFADFWQHAVAVGGEAFALKAEFHLLLLLTHLVKHLRYSSAGIRMYLDFAMILKKRSETLDWAWILQEVERLKLTKFFTLLLSAVAQWFELPLPEGISPAEEELCEELLAFTMEGGVFGLDGEKRSRARVCTAAEKGKNPKWAAWKEILFPPVKEAAKRYTYLEKAPFLLPVAWVDRIFRNSKSIWRKFSQLKGILKTDETEVQRDLEFRRKIGV